VADKTDQLWNELEAQNVPNLQAASYTYNMTPQDRIKTLLEKVDHKEDLLSKRNFSKYMGLNNFGNGNGRIFDS